MGAAKTLRAVADNPWLRLVSATVLLASGGYEAVQTLEEMSFGAHHGVTLYGAITAHTRGSSALLPLLLFPLVVPALMAAASGTSAAMEGDVMGSTPGWALLLLAFNAIHWSVSGLLFRFVVEDA